MTRREVKRPVRQDDITEESEAPSRALSPDVDEADELPPVDELLWAKNIFEEMGDKKGELLFTDYSNKAKIALAIVKEAVKMKENILIFVHSIPTLEYIKEKLDRKVSRVYVLTGSTPMKDRQANIDKFNRDTSAVYLISCKVCLHLII
jgi:superfamily II DNA or RNA helicase